MPESKKETTSTAAANKERAKPKQYTKETFKTELTKDEEKEFEKLDKDEQKKFIVKRWFAENKYLDTIDQHEISLEDMQLAGLMPKT